MELQEAESDDSSVSETSPTDNDLRQRKISHHKHESDFSLDHRGDQATRPTDHAYKSDSAYTMRLPRLREETFDEGRESGEVEVVLSSSGLERDNIDDSCAGDVVSAARAENDADWRVSFHLTSQES